jgi:hypothetical protein
LAASHNLNFNRVIAIDGSGVSHGGPSNVNLNASDTLLTSLKAYLIGFDHVTEKSTKDGHLRNPDVTKNFIFWIIVHWSGLSS